jgi:hypothetical protein
MRERKRSVLVYGTFLSVGILLGALLVWVLTGAGERGQGVGRGALDTPQESFSLSGEPSSAVISPGVFVPLDLSISNSNDVTLVVTEIEVTVSAVSAPNATKLLPCTVKDFKVNQLDTKLTLTVDPGETVALSKLGLPSTAWPQVGMPIDKKTNQDGCKGASLTLSYSGVGQVDQ